MYSNSTAELSYAGCAFCVSPTKPRSKAVALHKRAKALGVSARTIRADIAALTAAGYCVPTRGKLHGVGRGQTHKVLIVELYLKRHTYTEIARRTHHSVYAIKRYIQVFGRVMLLTRRGLSVPEIAHAVGISEHLTQEYLSLYQRYDVPEYQDRLTEIVQMLSGGVQETDATAKRGL